MGGVASNFEIQKMKSAGRSDRSKTRSKEHLVFKKKRFDGSTVLQLCSKVKLALQKTHTHTKSNQSGDASGRKQFKMFKLISDVNVNIYCLLV